MKKSGRKMKRTTKNLLLISLACLVLGLGFGTVGVLQGPSSWAYWNGAKFVTSNAEGTSAEKKELQPFSSLEIAIPTGVLTVEEGEKYAIDYQSNWPGVKPILKEENGKLSLTTEENASGTVAPINPVQEMIQDKNYVTITVPKGTKLDLVELNQKSEWCHGRTNPGVEQNLSFDKIDVAQFKTSEENFYDGQLSFAEGQYDAVELHNVGTVEMQDLKAGTVAIEHEGDFYYSEIYWKLSQVTADSLTMNGKFLDREGLLHPENEQKSNGYNGMSTSLTDCNIGTMDILSGNITIENSNANKAVLLAQDRLEIKSGNFGQEATLRAGTDMKIKATQPQTAFNGLLAVGSGYRDNIITKQVEYGTDDYNFAYVNEASKVFGTKRIPITQEQYYFLSQHRQSDSHSYNNGYEQYSTYAMEDKDRYTGANAPFNSYVELDSHWSDSGKNEFFAEIYNRKVVSYYVGEKGQKIYINNASVAKTITVNTVIPEQFQRYSLSGGSVRMDAYCYGNMNVEFAT